MNGHGLIPEEMERLLGGYATGTLSSAEHDALMKAALEDQALFDALMDEEALREALAEPATRRALLEALGAGRQRSRLARRWWWIAAPAALSLAVAVWLVSVPGRKETRVEVATTSRQDAPAKALELPVAQAPSSVPAPSPPPAAKPEKKDAALPPAEQAASREKGAVAETLREEEKKAAAAPEPARLTDQNRATFGAPAAPARAEARKAEADALANAPADVRSADKAAAVGKVVAAQAASFVEPGQILVAVLAYRDPDGRWHDARASDGVPAGRPLRLTVTSGQSGTLVLRPALAEARPVEAGKSVEIPLPPQTAGELPVDLVVNTSVPEGSGAQALRLRETPARTVPSTTRLSLRIKILE
jgi:hypothetical protein